MNDRQNALSINQALSAYRSHADLLAARSNTKDPQEQIRLAPMEHRAYARERAAEDPFSAALTFPLLIPGYYAAKKSGLQDARTPASLEQVQQGFAGLGEGLGISGQRMLQQLMAYGRN